MREIELKYQVNNFDEIIKILEYNKCKISKIQYQSDTIFIEDLNKTAINLGIDSKNIVNSHYDTMIHNLKG